MNCFEQSFNRTYLADNMFAHFKTYLLLFDTELQWILRAERWGAGDVYTLTKSFETVGSLQTLLAPSFIPRHVCLSGYLATLPTL